ncbi:hypothetical protein WJX77_010536 [Trebouxia sp. C0004]
MILTARALTHDSDGLGSALGNISQSMSDEQGSRLGGQDDAAVGLCITVLGDLLVRPEASMMRLQLTCIMAADFSEGAETEAASAQEWRHRTSQDAWKAATIKQQPLMRLSSKKHL